MIASCWSCRLEGMLVERILVEAKISPGFPSFIIVGLAGTAIQESRERIRAAFHSMGVSMPLGRILVNLYPGDVRKGGSHWDLPIAVSLWGAMDLVEEKKLGQAAFLGELALDGKLRPVPGAFAMCLALKKEGIRHIYLPYANLPACREIAGLFFYPVHSLYELLQDLQELRPIPAVEGKNGTNPPRDWGKLDYSDLVGREDLKRLVMLAVAGRHSFLFIGPPGMGKTMALERLPSVLPELSGEEMEEVRQIYSAAGVGEEEEHPYPFRRPHPSITRSALIGGGNPPVAGEISLAHHGVLCLDELAYFPSDALEALRMPMESHTIHLARGRQHICLGADFLLAAAMNPCPCGYYGDQERACSCRPYEVEKYRKKISGPLLDRIAILYSLGPAEKKKETKAGLSSRQMREKILLAQERQAFRYRGEDFSLNGRFPDSADPALLGLSQDLLKKWKKLKVFYQLSGRRARHVLLLARSLADLEEKDQVQEKHILEAFQYAFFE